MNTVVHPWTGAGAGNRRRPANERFKEQFGSWFWRALALAAVLHFLLFELFPPMRAADVSFTAQELEAIDLPQEIEIPPPPQQIARPATPVVSEANIEEDITIAPTTFEENPIDELPPPPTPGTPDLARAPQFTPFTVKPELKNRTEVEDALKRYYPPLLRDAGIEGTVLVWFFIDETGRVRRSQIHTSSGHTGLDQAALRVAEIMEFRPAQNRDKRVPVWVALPIEFTVR